MGDLFKKIGVGVILGLVSLVSGCGGRAYFGANDPALKYLPDAQKQDTEATVKSLDGGIPLYVVKFD